MLARPDSTHEVLFKPPDPTREADYDHSKALLNSTPKKYHNELHRFCKTKSTFFARRFLLDARNVCLVGESLTCPILAFQAFEGLWPQGYSYSWNECMPEHQPTARHPQLLQTEPSNPQGTSGLNSPPCLNVESLVSPAANPRWHSGRVNTAPSVKV